MLIAHYWNHYAMIYALREWKHAGTGIKQREMLTAKPGQRPGRWLSWHEMRRWLLQWHGYALFRFGLLPDPRQVRAAAEHQRAEREVLQRQRTDATLDEMPATVS